MTKNSALSAKYSKRIGRDQKRYLQSFLKKTLVNIGRPNSGDAEDQHKHTAEPRAVSFHSSPSDTNVAGNTAEIPVLCVCVVFVDDEEKGCAKDGDQKPSMEIGKLCLKFIFFFNFIKLPKCGCYVGVSTWTFSIGLMTLPRSSDWLPKRGFFLLDPKVPFLHCLICPLNRISNKYLIHYFLVLKNYK